MPDSRAAVSEKESMDLSNSFAGRFRQLDTTLPLCFQMNDVPSVMMTMSELCQKSLDRTSELLALSRKSSEVRAANELW